jgi:hypothetical protein
MPEEFIMYLHLGQNVVVPEAEIIGIFDLDNTTGSHITRKFLSDAEKDGRVINVSDELPYSFVVCGREVSATQQKKQSLIDKRGRVNNVYEEEKVKVYLSQLSSQTLLKRSGAMRII